MHVMCVSLHYRMSTLYDTVTLIVLVYVLAEPFICTCECYITSKLTIQFQCTLPLK